MASSYRRSSVDTANHRPLFRNKQFNDVLRKPETRREHVNISQLSPEAQKVMTMTQEDATEKARTSQRIIHDAHNNNTSSNRLGHREVKVVSSSKDSKSSSRDVSLRPLGPRIRGSSRSSKVTTSSLGASFHTATERSRSTLSLTDRNFSISDNTESVYNYSPSNIMKVPNNAIGSSDTKDEKVPNINLTKPQQNQQNEEDCINENSEKIHNDERKSVNEEATSPTSFVLALDQALEENCVSRLKGDITSRSPISEPGKVRALDGGRLTNAQEVVVNVCHDDNRELVFHDDDEESLITAKVVSEFRINLWMKFNEGFQPEAITDDIYIGQTEETIGTLERIIEAKPFTQEKSIVQASKVRTVNKLLSDKSCSVSRNSNKKKWQSMKRDVNNNSNATTKSKSCSYNGLRDISPVRTNSTNISSANKEKSN